MGCTNCNQTAVICQETTPDCGCPVTDLSTDCVQYTGDTATCSGILNGVTLTEYLEQLETYICTALDELTGTTLVNVGSGAGVYKGIDILGRKELRTFKSTDESVSIVVDGNEIDFSVSVQETVEITSEDNSVTVTQTENTFDLSVEATAVEAGDNVTITGVGTQASPYVVVSTDTIVTLENGTTTTIAGNGTTTPYSVETVNLQKTILLDEVTPYVLQASDDKYTIFVENGGTDAEPSFIEVPNTLPNNFSVVFINEATDETVPLKFREVTSGTANIITPDGYDATITGNATWACLEKKLGTQDYYLLGNLTETP